jgi:beta-lactamase superfamily II metal-dependent hydrolase
MGIRFEFFEAGQGDSILVTTIQNKKEVTNILIDGGAGGLYTRKLRNLKKSLDLVILTHLDDDHILGLRDLLKFDVDKIAKKDSYIPYIKEVWYNAFRNTSNTNDIDFKPPKKSTTVSIKNQLKFREYMSFAKDKIQYRDYISVNYITEPLEVNDIKLILLSPNDDKLEELYLKYEKELPKTTISTFTKSKDFSSTIEDLYKKPFSGTDDSSESNGSSIAFILIYQDKKFLFLADAHIPLIIDSLKKVKEQYFKDEERMEFEFIKLSHHGSRNNINDEFLDLVQSENYVILTNSRGHRHPDKETLSKILVHNRKLNYPYKINFRFNYSAVAKDSRYGFTQEDKKKYNFELIHSNAYPFGGK